MRVISYRPPLGARILCVLFGTGVSVTLVAANTQDYASGRASAAVFPPLILMVLAVMTFAYRLAMQSFRADAAGVAVHNVFSTRHIPLAQITGFDVGSARFQFDAYRVRVITQSTTYPIGIYRPSCCLSGQALAGWPSTTSSPPATSR